MCEDITFLRESQPGIFIGVYAIKGIITPDHTSLGWHHNLIAYIILDWEQTYCLETTVAWLPF